MLHFYHKTGNYFYSYGALEKATKCYQEAIKLCGGEGDDKNMEGQAAGDGPTLAQLGIDCGNNLATCLSKRKMYKEAKEVCVGVLLMDPNNFKALYRGGQIASFQGEFKEATLALQKAAAIRPKPVQSELRLLAERKQAYKAKRARIGKKMMQRSKEEQEEEEEAQKENEKQRQTQEEEERGEQDDAGANPASFKLDGVSENESGRDGDNGEKVVAAKADGGGKGQEAGADAAASRSSGWWEWVLTRLVVVLPAILAMAVVFFWEPTRVQPQRGAPGARAGGGEL